MKKGKLTAWILGACALAWTAPTSGWSQEGDTIIYFSRHGEDMTALRETGKNGVALIPECVPYLDDGEVDFCCLDILSEQGETRAGLLADWLVGQQGVALTHVFSTYKTRTWQTALPSAQAAGLDVLGTDVDKNPGDGVQQIPPFVGECDAGFESPSSTRDQVVAALRSVPAGSRVLVVGHSGTIYPMMESMGIVTVNPDDPQVAIDFPRRPNGRVDGFNNLWAVQVDAEGRASLLEHYLLDFTLQASIP